MAPELPRSLDTTSKFALFSVSDLKDEKLIKKHTCMETETCKLYSEVFWIFLPNFIKIDSYNFELYRFKVGAFFWDTVQYTTVYTIVGLYSTYYTTIYTTLYSYEFLKLKYRITERCIMYGQQCCLYQQLVCWSVLTGSLWLSWNASNLGILLYEHMNSLIQQSVSLLTALLEAMKGICVSDKWSHVLIMSSDTSLK